MSEQRKHYKDKLVWEIASWDLSIAIKAGDNVTVVDARSVDAFAANHIPGAVNIPHRDMSPETTGSVDRDSLVVVYCDGIGCNASTKGALNMLNPGFQVRQLMGSLDWWIRNGHTTHAGPDSGPDCGCAQGALRFIKAQDLGSCLFRRFQLILLSDTSLGPAFDLRRN